MGRSIAATLIALVAAGSLVAPARAGSISGSLSGDTSLVPISTNVFLQAFAGEGHDTLLGSFTVQSQSTIDFSNPSDIVISNGALSEVYSEGTLVGTSSGDGTTTGPGTGTFEIDLVFTGGTGIFAGATGTATLTGRIVSTSPTTGEINGSYVGTLSSVPEPGTLALLGQAAALGAGLLARRRRGSATH